LTSFKLLFFLISSVVCNIETQSTETNIAQKYLLPTKSKSKEINLKVAHYVGS